jgi:hypothetical protein
MNLQQVSDQLIDTSMQLLPAEMDSSQARVMLLAIGLQESRFEHTHQIGGPAHGYWQFESGGGVKGVMTHPASEKHARSVCFDLGVPWARAQVFDAIEHDQVLACAFARLLLWTDPRALPDLGDPDGAWDCYIRNWRPGKPHPDTWPKFYQQALKFVQG